jgi:hypothetical protein
MSINNTNYGMSTLHNNIGSNNTAFGAYAGYNNLDASNNTGIGSNSLFYNTIGANNTGLGAGSLCNNNTGSLNTAIGSSALEGLVSDESVGNQNVAVGAQALYSNTGDLNTSIGTYAAQNVTNGSYNTFLGANTTFDHVNNPYQNSTAVGYNAVITGSNQIVLGGTGPTGYPQVIVPGGVIGPTGSFTTLNVSGVSHLNGPVYTPSGISGATGSFNNVYIQNTITNTDPSNTAASLIVNSSAQSVPGVLNSAILAATNGYEFGFATTRKNPLDNTYKFLGIYPSALDYGDYNPIVQQYDQTLVYGNYPYSPTNSGFSICPWSPNTSGLRMDASGNIGIGKSVPNATLDVNGTANFSGNVVGPTGSFTNLNVSGISNLNGVVNVPAGITGVTGSFNNLYVSGNSVFVGGITGSNGSFGSLSLQTYPYTYTDLSVVPKEYVDSVASGLKPAGSCICATTGDISGLDGQTPYGIPSASLTDGITLTSGNNGDSVLVVNQGSPTTELTTNVYNGVWIVNTAGYWTRPTSGVMATGSNASGAFSSVKSGIIYGSKVLVQQIQNAYVGTDPLSYSVLYQFNFKVGEGLIVTTNGTDSIVSVDPSLNFINHLDNVVGPNAGTLNIGTNTTNTIIGPTGGGNPVIMPSGITGGTGSFSYLYSNQVTINSAVASANPELSINSFSSSNTSLFINTDASNGYYNPYSQNGDIELLFIVDTLNTTGYGFLQPNQGGLTIAPWASGSSYTQASLRMTSSATNITSNLTTNGILALYGGSYYNNTYDNNEFLVQDSKLLIKGYTNSNDISVGNIQATYYNSGNNSPTGLELNSSGGTVLINRISYVNSGNYSLDVSGNTNIVGSLIVDCQSNTANTSLYVVPTNADDSNPFSYFFPNPPSTISNASALAIYNNNTAGAIEIDFVNYVPYNSSSSSYYDGGMYFFNSYNNVNPQSILLCAMNTSTVGYDTRSTGTLSCGSIYCDSSNNSTGTPAILVNCNSGNTDAMIILRNQNTTDGGITWLLDSGSSGAGIGANFAIYDVTNSATRLSISNTTGDVTIPNLLNTNGGIASYGDLTITANAGNNIFTLSGSGYDQIASFQKSAVATLGISYITVLQDNGSPQGILVGVDATNYPQFYAHAFIDTSTGGVGSITPLDLKVNGTTIMELTSTAVGCYQQLVFTPTTSTSIITASSGYGLTTQGLTLGTSTGNCVNFSNFNCATGNDSQLVTYAYRFVDGSNWTTSSLRIAAITDSTNQGYIEFNNPNYSVALRCSQTSSGLYVDSAGNTNIENNLICTNINTNFAVNNFLYIASSPSGGPYNNIILNQYGGGVAIGKSSCEANYSLDVSPGSAGSIYTDNGNINAGSGTITCGTLAAQSGGGGTLDLISSLNLSGYSLSEVATVYCTGSTGIVVQDSSSYGYITVNSGYGNNPGYIAFFDPSSTSSTHRVGYIGYSGSVTGYIDIAIDGGSGYTGYYCTNNFLCGGYLGINTTSPGYQLDVNGTIRITNGNVFLANNSSGTAEDFLWPRWVDNITYLNYGSAGFNIRNNSSITTMFMTNSGYVGIGTTSPGYQLDVNGSINSSSTLSVSGATTLSSTLSVSGTLSAGSLVYPFYNCGGTIPNSTNPNGGFGYTAGNYNSGTGECDFFNTYYPNQGTYYAFCFYKYTSITAVSLIMSIASNGAVAASAFNATSDYRIKEDIKPINNTIDNLKPIQYYNKNLEKEDMGFIAHEVQEEFPFLVSGEKDGEDMQSLNYTGLIALLVKEVQDLKRENKLFKEKLEQLEGFINK